MSPGCASSKPPRWPPASTLADQGVRAGQLCCSCLADCGDGDPYGRAGRLEPVHLGR